MEDKEEKNIALEADLVIIGIILFLVAILPAVMVAVNGYFSGHSVSIEAYWSLTSAIAKQIFIVLTTLSFPISLFFLIGIVYCVEQLKHIRQKENQIFDTKVELAIDPQGSGDPVLTHRWENIKAHITSENPNDWKQAIMESDIILEEVLTSLGYRGDGIGEKLKRVLPGEMKTLNEAWEAHKVRNSIAHEGSSFALTHYDAQKVINMYKKVFEEFYYI